MPSPEEITRHHQWDPPHGEQIWIDGEPTSKPVHVVEHDPAWLAMYTLVADQIREVLGSAVIGLDHVGSTSVPGLPAKPVIDVDLTVADSTAEATYVPALEAVGFKLVLRERGWHEHRLLSKDHPPTNLHVFSPGCPEVIRHRMFRDWLRTHPDDRALYRDVKLKSAEASRRAGEKVSDYNTRKQPAIREIYERIFRAHGLA
jgi:GrpB-like predicted nucleotidyltransferase (UPF0157 family)